MLNLMGLFLRKNHLLKCWGWLCFLNWIDWGAYIISIAKTVSKKIWVLICSLKFFSPEVALYLYKSTIQPCMEYCCHVWVSVPSCYLELLDNLQKWICRTASPSRTACLEPWAHFQNVASFKVTSSTKQQLLKMCHLRHRLRIYVPFLRYIQVLVFLAIPWFTKSMMSWWVLVHETGWIFEHIFWTTTN